ncbi:hypothetical protein M422DRAFT_44114 [Sphaerobolus stellatus SS14]|nr:hypothetical protein M422DRAFT_44114 [Sphaerobolus stellatus SS14]
MEEMQPYLSRMEQPLQECQGMEKHCSIIQKGIGAPLAPFRLLIPELLAIIFEFCIEVDKPSFRSRNHAPLVLAHICRFWRQLAFNCPSLWLNIRFGRSPTPDALSMWLVNSRNSPLDLHFTIASSRVGLVAAVRNILAQEIHRCRAITLICSYPTLKQLLPAQISHAHKLRSLSVYSGETDHYRGQLQDFEWIAEFPNLESLQLIDAGFLLKGLGTMPHLREFRVRHNLAEFYAGPMERISFASLDAIIQACLSLEVLEFDMGYLEFMPDTDMAAIAPFECPHLHRLKLTLDTVCSPDTLFFPRKFNAPNLKYIGVDGARWTTGDGVHELLLRLVYNSRNTLEHLTLENLDMLSSEALPSFQATVERLKISFPTFAKASTPASNGCVRNLT